jgi:hypothetical protein
MALKPSLLGMGNYTPNSEYEQDVIFQDIEFYLAFTPSNRRFYPEKACTS